MEWKGNPRPYAEICVIIGDGNFKKGFNLVQNLAERLIAARKKHKWGKQGEISSYTKASIALEDEHAEWDRAMAAETPERQGSEALDILTVATRIANMEYK